MCEDSPKDEEQPDRITALGASLDACMRFENANYLLLVWQPKADSESASFWFSQGIFAPIKGDTLITFKKLLLYIRSRFLDNHNNN